MDDNLVGEAVYVYQNGVERYGIVNAVGRGREGAGEADDDWARSGEEADIVWADGTRSWTPVSRLLSVAAALTEALRKTSVLRIAAGEAHARYQDWIVEERGVEETAAYKLAAEVEAERLKGRGVADRLKRTEEGKRVLVALVDRVWSRSRGRGDGAWIYGGLVSRSELRRVWVAAYGAGSGISPGQIKRWISG